VRNFVLRVKGVAVLRSLIVLGGPRFMLPKIKFLNMKPLRRIFLIVKDMSPQEFQQKNMFACF
jgi:hypothetical protein